MPENFEPTLDHLCDVAVREANSGVYGDASKLALMGVFDELYRNGYTVPVWALDQRTRPGGFDEVHAAQELESNGTPIVPDEGSADRGSVDPEIITDAQLNEVIFIVQDFEDAKRQAQIKSNTPLVQSLLEAEIDRQRELLRGRLARLASEVTR